ncbi:hypothetical protein BDN72DRAFT_841478 [Pluteus cervinus]|uniref:Uncharacterized protein n=1 Tax=Pluteus cervinus TaxID=181527 RepID=A0ACD3AT60_9AGAR|nr:hypothetical protein BDN72DRAFT_841478 [Pluteus cervinus]
MLGLDDLLEQHAYADSPSPPDTDSPRLSRPTPLVPPSQFDISFPIASLTKPVPPPATLARKLEPSSLSQRVVHPPKESCFNLPIIFPSIPEGGTKSRVETQVRVTVDLADSSSSSDPHKYARVGSWKWLKLPQGTATKRRTRKQGKIDPDLQDVLQLSATITCASPPHNRVLSCSSCQAREAKRVAKKLAARVRPARSDSESADNSNSIAPKSKHTEDTTSIIQFNCAEVLDFSTGSVVLPLRITCYCRHHREKVGFIIHFTMIDHSGRIVGSGSSRPIMITDDHKTATLSHPRHANSFPNTDAEWLNPGALPQTGSSRAHPKRRRDPTATGASKKRPKPYDSVSKPVRPSREGSITSLPSPSTSSSNLPLTRSPTPPGNSSHFAITDLLPLTPQLQHSSHLSSPDTVITPLDHCSDLPGKSPGIQVDFPQDGPYSLPIMSTPIPYMFFNPHQTPQNLLAPVPTIHRLIPNMGPTHGGIEVTVLGNNFLPSMQLNCVFGDVAASSTQRWSDNTLVCVLPPRATAGVVAVWFDGYPKADEHNGPPPSLFTYSDESDRALMELALQVVGLKMTGKIEDAKNVAMRIVGGTGNDSSNPQHDISTMMVQMSSSPGRDLRSLFLSGGETEEFEKLVIDLLSVMKTPVDPPTSKLISITQALSHPTSGGHTILHLAAYMRFTSLVTFLVEQGADIDARDRNGYTPLHFAALSRSTQCASVLLQAGADVEIVDGAGKTAEEISGKEFFIEVASGLHIDDDDESCWGDAEEDDADSEEHIRRFSHRTPRRLSRRGVLGKRPSRTRLVGSSRTSTPPPPSIPQDPKSVDVKQSAWLLEMLQRTLSQLPAPQGILPSKLPLPQFPQLAVPAVPWGALPQIPMVFPVFIPMPAFPSLFGGDDQSLGDKGDQSHKDDSTSRSAGTAQEWRAMVEKWIALAAATTARAEPDDAPPMYTPRVEVEQAAQTSAPEPSQQESDHHPIQGEDLPRPATLDMRRVGYDMVPVTDQEVNAFAYRPPHNRTRKLQKQHDRMLLLFWLPILLLSLIWAFHHGIRLAFNFVRNSTALRNSLRT